MRELGKNLYIGLGGTGINTIKLVKEEFMRNYGVNGELPPMIRFLGIDSVVGKRPAGLDDRDFFGLMENHSMAYYQNKDNKKEIDEWFDKKNIAPLSKIKGEGCGQYRTNGRFLIMMNKGKLAQRITSILHSINADEGNNEETQMYRARGEEINVNIIFSICGGTGSGTFIDTAFLIREIAGDTVNVRINGYAFLPGIFDEIIKGKISKQRIYPNAYGALLDMDYLMSVSQSKYVETPIELKIFGETSSKKPFDKFYCIDNSRTSEDGSDPVNYVRKIEDLEYMLSQTLLADSGEVGQYGIEVDDNDDESNYTIKNKIGWIRGVGTFVLSYDAQSVADVFSLKIQKKIINQIIGTVSADVNAIANNWIDNEACIREDSGKDQVIDSLCDMSKITAFTLSKDDYDKKTVVDVISKKFESYSSRCLKINNIEKNLEDLYKTKSLKLSEKISDLLSQYNSVSLVVNFLKEINNQIKNSFMKEMKEEIELKQCAQKEAQSLRTTNITALAQWLKTFHLFSKDDDNYISKIKIYAQNEVTALIEENRRKAANTFYQKLCADINSYICDFENLNTVLKNYEDALDDEISRKTSPKFNNFFDDLSAEDRRSVSVDDIELPMTEIVKLLPNGKISCNLGKQDFIKAFENYIQTMPQYKEYLKTNIVNVLSKLKVQNEKLLETKLQKAVARSNVYLNYSSQGLKYKVGDDLVGSRYHFYVCIPEDSNRGIEDIVKKVLGENFTVIKTGFENKIMFCKKIDPISPFNFTGYEKYKSEYDSLKSTIGFSIDISWLKDMEDSSYSMEPKSDEENYYLITWIRACILGKIKFEREYQYETEQVAGAKVFTPFKLENQATPFRDKAFKAFVEMTDFHRKVEEDFVKHLKNIGQIEAENLKQDVLKNYYDNYSQCQLAKPTVLGSKVQAQYKGTREMLKQETTLLDAAFDID